MKYEMKNTKLMIINLPTKSEKHCYIQISSSKHQLFEITQNRGQRILIGNSQTRSGIKGKIASTSEYNSIGLVCIKENKIWRVVEQNGNFEIT